MKMIQRKKEEKVVDQKPSEVSKYKKACPFCGYEKKSVMCPNCGHNSV